MDAVLLVALWFAAPEPTPVPGAVPDATFTRPHSRTGAPVGWCDRPLRPTKFWRGVGGLLFCDDPACPWCADTVYGTRQWEGAKPIRR